MTNTREEAMQELRDKIEWHILALREDVKNAGFNTGYITMASFEDEEKGINCARFTNGAQVKREDRIDFFYTIKDMEQ